MPRPRTAAPHIETGPTREQGRDPADPATASRRYRLRDLRERLLRQFREMTASTGAWPVGSSSSPSDLGLASLNYACLRGEGWIPVPLPPPVDTLSSPDTWVTVYSGNMGNTL